MITTKEEDHGKNTKASYSTSTSTQWSRLKDPRIVRVSRAFGGKDRHSKVCTVRGLRDRRVRLSVPTAIQLYDLQDRLGLNQPSKVVDWLLDAAKHEIDELPPLQVPNFGPNHQALLIDPTQSSKEELKNNSSVNWEDSLGLARSNFWDFDANLRDKAKEVATDEVATIDEDEKWNRRNKEEKQGNVEISPNNFFPTSNQLSIPGLLNNVVPYNSFYRLEPSSFSFAPQAEANQNFNVGIAQPYFPSNLGEFDPKQINQFHWLSSGSQNPLSNSLSPNLYPTSQLMKPLQLSMAPNNDEFPPK